MTGPGIAQMVAYAIVLMLLAWPLGLYMAAVYQGENRRSRKLFGWLERGIYKVGGVDAEEDMPWTRYAFAVIAFNMAGLVVVYLLQRLQTHLPGNPNHLPAVNPQIAWNTAVSFATNTNWQTYYGENTMSHLVQMLALTVQNFVSAATGMAVLVALVRGFTRKHANGIGNFWVDLTRSTLYILAPLSIILALFLVWQGVPQTTHGHHTATSIEQVQASDGSAVTTQDIAVGPVASQVAIKQLGTNGGGYYNANSAHPLENPTPLSNFFECIAILLIAAALCITFGKMVGRLRQGLALLVAMWVMFVPILVICYQQEAAGNPRLEQVAEHRIDQTASDTQPGGNMEGKETRYGVSASTLWATATTAASNGSVNSMHDSYTPIGGMMPMFMIALGEVVFGGVGSGLYGLILFAVVAVFIAGLMVGRTPEFLGKKIEAHEMKLASWGILVPVAAVLIGTAIACMTTQKTTVPNPGAHGFSEMLYAFTSQANNNGSAFAGLTASGPFWATAGGIVMFAGRYWITIAVLAMAGSLARKKMVPTTAGTLPTEGPLFVILLVGVVFLVGVLSFVPAMALGPIAEQVELHP